MPVANFFSVEVDYVVLVFLNIDIVVFKIENRHVNAPGSE